MVKSNTSHAEVNQSCIEKLCSILNYLTVLALIAASVVRFTHFTGEDAPSDPFFYLLTIYLIPFALLVLFAELRYARVLKYFEFLGHQHGKGLFLVFLSLLIFDTKYPVDTAVSVGATIVGIFNLVTMCITPSGKSALRLFGKSKDSDATTSEDVSSDISENDADDFD